MKAPHLWRFDMKDYSDYGLEDFLLDDEFREWITLGDSAKTIDWNEISFFYPEKKVTMDKAREIIITLLENNSTLSHDELELEVSRILHSTEDQKTGFNPLLLRLNWLSVAASILICLSIGWAITRNIRQPQATKLYKQYVSLTGQALREVVNTTGKSLQVKLPDGSLVRLTPSSRISYSGIFVQNNKREIYLSGEAFFEVQKDTRNPFFVYANGLLTRVVGTSFLIRAIDADVEVLVRSGRVTVLPMKDMETQDKKNTELLLTPNQQALFSTKDNLISKSIVSSPVEIEKDKVEPDFTFENHPISAVFAILEKAYGIPIVYDETIMRKCSLTVALSNEPFFTKLDIICKTVGAGYVVRDGQIIISSEGCE